MAGSCDAVGVGCSARRDRSLAVEADRGDGGRADMESEREGVISKNGTWRMKHRAATLCVYLHILLIGVIIAAA